MLARLGKDSLRIRRTCSRCTRPCSAALRWCGAGTVQCALGGPDAWKAAAFTAMKPSRNSAREAESLQQVTFKTHIKEQLLLRAKGVGGVPRPWPPI